MKKKIWSMGKWKRKKEKEIRSPKLEQGPSEESGGHAHFMVHDKRRTRRIQRSMRVGHWKRKRRDTTNIFVGGANPGQPTNHHGCISKTIYYWKPSESRVHLEHEMSANNIFPYSFATFGCVPGQSKTLMVPNASSYCQSLKGCTIGMYQKWFNSSG